jgi:molecular chaperone DnaK
MFELTGLPPAPRGVPKIEVSFDIDANGIVHVNAQDLGTGQEQSMTITGGSALPKDDFERLMRDAEAHADEDKKRREEAEVRNTGDQLVYQTEKFLADNSDKVPADGKTEVEAALAELKTALASTDEGATESIKSATEKVATSSQKLGAAMYADAQPSGDAGAGDAGSGGDAGGSDDDVVDAEIVDEEENK